MKITYRDLLEKRKELNALPYQFSIEGQIMALDAALNIMATAERDCIDRLIGYQGQLVIDLAERRNAATQRGDTATASVLADQISRTVDASIRLRSARRVFEPAC